MKELNQNGGNLLNTFVKKIVTEKEGEREKSVFFVEANETLKVGNKSLGWIWLRKF